MTNTPYQPMIDDFTKVYINEDLQVERYVVCAANRRKNDGIIICGARHWDKIMNDVAQSMGDDNYSDWDQGFIDQYGFYLTRKEAADIVISNKQQLRDYEIRGGELYSENLY